MEGTNPVRVGVGLTNRLGRGAEAECCTSLGNLRWLQVLIVICARTAKIFSNAHRLTSIATCALVQGASAQFHHRFR